MSAWIETGQEEDKNKRAKNKHGEPPDFRIALERDRIHRSKSTRGEQIEIVQSDDDLAASEKFFEISATIERRVGEKLLPESRFLLADAGLNEHAAMIHAFLV
jgi:hypothetical protein